MPRPETKRKQGIRQIGVTLTYGVFELVGLLLG